MNPKAALQTAKYAKAKGLSKEEAFSLSMPSLALQTLLHPD
jgi:hypothetical protein